MTIAWNAAVSRIATASMPLDCAMAAICALMARPCYLPGEPLRQLNAGTSCCLIELQANEPGENAIDRLIQTQPASSRIEAHRGVEPPNT